MNLSNTFLGKPRGAVVNNLFNYALGSVFELSSKSILFGEIYGNTSALGGAEVLNYREILKKIRNYLEVKQ